MPKPWKDKYLWIIVAIFIFLTLLYYAPDIPSLNWLSMETNLGITRRAFERGLFLIPIILAGWRFGFKQGLICAIISAIIMIPRVIVSPFRADATAETVVVIAAGIVISLLVGKLEESRKRLLLLPMSLPRLICVSRSWTGSSLCFWPA